MLSYPKAYVDYLVEFHATRDFFECHELLEEYWKEHPSDPLERTWVGLIQLAVGLYHERRGNRRGADKMLTQAVEKLSVAPLDKLGLDKEYLQKQIKSKLSDLNNEQRQQYTDLDMTIISEELMGLCTAACIDRGLTWGMPSPMQDESIIHRHTNRDRSDVILARKQAHIAKRKRMKPSSGG
ncbi:DUF309 domain-containing protein [Paenibacillus sinopodophylli]|uniref:DUF309 domain-containing protein n=1 Tax=Paenibacillus sinopodophylli TaxID=1837342 RepID=UPI00110CF5A2|nr:DUF309 domain-containing protein [Paenibacillus sinopodophylli]